MSSVIGEDTADTINSGRETLGSGLRTVQLHLQKVFIAFVIGLIGTIILMRSTVWPFLEATAKQNMAPSVADKVDIIAVTPFDVILLQFKIGAIVGVLLAIPTLAYLARDEIKQRSPPAVPISKWQVLGVATLSLVLFVLGMAYAYNVFFPVMFSFLAENALNAGIQPKYGIVEFTQFMVYLTLSFGLAAQLPLLMSALTYSEIVPYEFFRDKWRYAFIGIFTVGMLASPPDPFTQVMWGVPLCGLYVLSLAMSKVVTNVRRSEARSTDAGDLSALRRKLLQFAGVFAGGTLLTVVALGAGAVGIYNSSVRPAFPKPVRPPATSLEAAAPIAGTFGGLFAGVFRWWNTGLVPALPASVRPPTLSTGAVPLSGLELAPITASLLGGFLIALLAASGFVARVLQQPMVPRDPRERSDPADLDIGELDAAGVRAAPLEAFQALEEEEALSMASDAMDADEPDRAQAILDRFDEAEEAAAMEEAAEAAEAAANNPTAEDTDEWFPEEIDSDADEMDEVGEATDAAADEESSFFAERAAGMVDPFTEEETTEDDIGGYYYDIQFILESLTSKMFRVVGTFMAVLFGTFYLLYSGGLGDIREQFLARADVPICGEGGITAADRATATTTGGYPGPLSLGKPFLLGESSGPAQLIQGGCIRTQEIVIARHPVEALIFEVKVSAIVGAMVALPVLLYYAWPAIQERGLAAGGGDRRLFFLWGGAILAGFVGGGLLGFFFVAPGVVSFLVQDAVEANMVVAYRLKHFFWLVFLLTGGIGLLVDIVVTMVLFERGGLVSYEQVRDGWRVVVFGVFVGAMFATPNGMLTMLIVAAPVSLAFLLGLGILWLLTLPDRLRGRRASPS